MCAAERREKIEQLLRAADRPLSASHLAAIFSVSRQIIVGDIALMRAGGLRILATPRGYVLEQQTQDNMHFERSIACMHAEDQLREEIYTIIDHGGAILDVTVEHSVYGEICAPLHLFSRFDADVFLEKIDDLRARPLSALTDGAHLHRIRCADEKVFQRITQALREAGILFEKE